MASRKPRIDHSEIVRLFAARLRELRHSRGMTQAELALHAHITASYVGRLESAGAAPGIDLLDRLASALGTTPTDLLPISAPTDSMAVLRDRAKKLFDAVLQSADRDALVMINPLLARLGESLARSR